MVTRLWNWIRSSRQRKAERIAADYGNLSKADKHVVETHRPMTGTWVEEQDFGGRPRT